MYTRISQRMVQPTSPRLATPAAAGLRSKPLQHLVRGQLAEGTSGAVERTVRDDDCCARGAVTRADVEVHTEAMVSALSTI